MKTDASTLIKSGFERVASFEYVVDGLTHLHTSGATLPTYAQEHVGAIEYIDKNGKLKLWREYAGQRVGTARAKLAAVLSTEDHPRAKAVKWAMRALPPTANRHLIEDVTSAVIDGIIDPTHNKLVFSKLYPEKLKEGSNLLCLADIDLGDDGHIAAGDVVTVTGFVNNHPIIQGDNGTYVENDTPALKLDYRLIYKLKVPK